MGIYWREQQEKLLHLLFFCCCDPSKIHTGVDLIQVKAKSKAAPKGATSAMAYFPLKTTTTG